MKLDSWSASDIGLVRQSNQDSIGHLPERGLFIVADGMGGHAAGEVASRLAVDVIAQSLQGDAGGSNPPGNGIPDALRAAVERANRSIYEAGMQAEEEEEVARRMGSTVVLLQVDVSRRHAYWAHVGDSRLYRVRNGTLTLLTADHTVHGDRYANATEIPIDLPHTNVLLQALGTQPEVRVPLGADPIQTDDLFLLCSDGVSALVSPADIRDTLTRPANLEVAGAALIQAALEAGGKDNASAILVRLRDV